MPWPRVHAEGTPTRPHQRCPIPAICSQHRGTPGSHARRRYQRGPSGLFGRPSMRRPDVRIWRELELGRAALELVGWGAPPLAAPHDTDPSPARTRPSRIPRARPAGSAGQTRPAAEACESVWGGHQPPTEGPAAHLLRVPPTGPQDGRTRSPEDAPAEPQLRRLAAATIPLRRTESSCRISPATRTRSSASRLSANSRSWAIMRRPRAMRTAHGRRIAATKSRICRRCACTAMAGHVPRGVDPNVMRPGWRLSRNRHVGAGYQSGRRGSPAARPEAAELPLARLSPLGQEVADHP